MSYFAKKIVISQGLQFETLLRNKTQRFYTGQLRIDEIN
jgi:hypothetical protein